MSQTSLTSLYPDFDRLDIVALTIIEDYGPVTVRAHLERIRTEQQSIDDGIPASTWRAAKAGAKRHLATAAKIGARCILDGDPDYPHRLLVLENRPVVLWTWGDIAVADAPLTISIVGTRVCTAYGERVTRSLANAFARCGAVVVSGMARGVDAAAHLATLESNGRTIAVLGTGVDVPYPVAHKQLHARIRKTGLIITESPPGATAIKGAFPRRNRIIAALGGATIVVEAGVKSGALITANLAAALGRDVGVVPGQIDSPASLGSNIFMRDGGHPLATVEDALALIGISQPGKANVELASPTEQAVWDALEQPAANFDVLCARTRLPARVCLETVTALEIRGIVDCAMTGELRRR